MPTSSFRVKTEKNKLNSIYMRFKQGNLFDVEVSTGIKVPRGKWSKSLQKINNTDLVDVDGLNEKLRGLKTHIQSKYSIDSVSGTIINGQWLKNHINNYLKRKSKEKTLNEKLFLIDFLEHFINDAKKRLDHPSNPIKYRTIQHYRTTQNKIKSYEQYSNKRVMLKEVSLSFHEDFIKFLEEEHHLNLNTIGGYIDVIKQVCNSADIKGYEVNSAYKTSNFYTPSNKTFDTYLTIPEIHKIYDCILEQDYLDNARDWLIISVWTGLRVSDLLSLNQTNIDGDYIKKDTLKTKFPVIIPIHEHVKQILKKRDGAFPRKISDVKYNKYIKEVCRLAEITEIIKGAKMCPKKITENGKKRTIHRKKFGKFPKFELISSHVGRRSFASNHYGKLDTMVLMKITGHKTEKQFLDYIKITPDVYAQKLKQYWEKNKPFLNQE